MLTGHVQAVTGARASNSQRDRFIDRFRYLIIASQLLEHETRPQVGTDCETALRETGAFQSREVGFSSVQGCAVTLALSFFFAWILRSATARSSETPKPVLNACVILLLLATVAVGIYRYARRKALQRMRLIAVDALSNLVTQSHRFDQIARSTLGLIQEVEVVSRGYVM